MYLLYEIIQKFWSNIWLTGEVGGGDRIRWRGSGLLCLRSQLILLPGIRLSCAHCSLWVKQAIIFPSSGSFSKQAAFPVFLKSCCSFPCRWNLLLCSPQATILEEMFSLEETLVRGWVKWVGVNHQCRVSERVQGGSSLLCHSVLGGLETNLCYVMVSMRSLKGGEILCSSICSSACSLTSKELP